MKLALISGVLIGSSFILAAAPANPPPTMDQIQGLYSKGDYDGTLRDIAHAMSLGGKAAESYDKHDLLVLRGEAELRLKQPSPAAVAFHQAAKETKDDDQAASARATEILIKKSRQLQYTPKTVEKGKKPEPIDIVPADKRKDAMIALYTDELAAVTPRIRAAKEATSLTAIVSALKEVNARNLADLDIAAHGNNEATKQALTDLKDHASELMSKALDKLGKEVDRITSRAGEMVSGQRGNYRTGVTQDVSHQRGLSAGDPQELKQIEQTATQIAVAAQELVAALGDKTAANDIIEQANDVKDKAEKTLRTNLR